MKATRTRALAKGKSRLPAPLGPALRRAYDRYLKIVCDLPGIEITTSYGTPAIKVRGKLLSRWRTEEEGALALRCDILERQILLQAQPEVFFLTEHYRDYPMVLVDLQKASREVLLEITERAWRQVAPPKLIRQHDSEPA